MEAVTLIITIVSLIIALGSSGYSISLGRMNADTKSAVSKLVAEVNREIASKRLSLNRIIALLTSHQNTALTTYLSNNPIISKTLTELENDAARINQIIADQSALESEINQLEGELSSLGYTSSHGGVSKENESRKRAEKTLDEKKAQYAALEEQAKAVHVSSTRGQVVNTADLDALSQNLKGGLK